MQFDESGMAGGRLSGIINVFKSMYFNESISSFLIGDGPGTLLGIENSGLIIFNQNTCSLHYP